MAKRLPMRRPSSRIRAVYRDPKRILWVVRTRSARSRRYLTADRMWIRRVQGRQLQIAARASMSRRDRGCSTAVNDSIRHCPKLVRRSSIQPPRSLMPRRALAQPQFLIPSLGQRRAFPDWTVSLLCIPLNRGSQFPPSAIKSASISVASGASQTDRPYVVRRADHTLRAAGKHSRFSRFVACARSPLRAANVGYRS